MIETPQFHSEIEKALETSGENIGRVKDIDLAHYWANAKEASYEDGESHRYMSDERDKELMSENIRHDITKRAIKDSADRYFLQNITTVATGTDPHFLKTPENYTQGLIDEGATVARQYDALHEMARQKHTEYQESREARVTVETPKLGAMEEVEGRATLRGTQVTDTEKELASRRIMELIANAATDDEKASLQIDYELIKGIVTHTVGGHSGEYAAGHATIKRYAVEQRWEVSGLQRSDFTTEKARDIEFAWSRAVTGQTSARDASLKARLDNLRVEKIVAEARGDTSALDVIEQERKLVEQAEKVLRLGDSSMLED